MKRKSLPSHISVKIPLGFIKHKWFLYGAAAVVILGAGAYWFIGTPQYSVWQMKQAAINHDADKAMRFINVDKLMDNVWPKFTSAMMAEASKTDDPFGMLGMMLGSGLIENMKPMLKEQLITGIKDSITGTLNSGDSGGEASSLPITKEDLSKFKLETSQGKTYLVAPAETADEVEMRYVLTRAEDGRYWQITDLDADWSKLFSNNPPPAL